MTSGVELSELLSPASEEEAELLSYALEEEELLLELPPQEASAVAARAQVRISASDFLTFIKNPPTKKFFDFDKEKVL